MRAIRLDAPAKINLFLHVTGRRPDGYHLLESLVVFADISDEIEVSPSDTFELTVQGPFAKDLSSTDNIVLKAARYLQKRHGIREAARIHLTKNIPISAGLGGGSSDAAAVILALEQLWNCPALPGADVLTQQLGADVPVCLRCQPTIMRGIGEDLSQAEDFPSCGVLLINPGRPVPTAEVFRAVRPPFSQPFLRIGPADWRTFEDLTAFLNSTKNDLTAPAAALAPIVNDCLNVLSATVDCALGRMTGSGATCFGLFRTEQEARGAANAISKSYPAWWIKSGKMLSMRAQPAQLTLSPT